MIAMWICCRKIHQRNVILWARTQDLWYGVQSLSSQVSVDNECGGPGLLLVWEVWRRNLTFKDVIAIYEREDIDPGDPINRIAMVLIYSAGKVRGGDFMFHAICDNPADHHVVRAAACRNIGEVYLSMHNYEIALPLLQTSSKIYIEYLGECPL